MIRGVTATTTDGWDQAAMRTMQLYNNMGKILQEVEAGQYHK
jgi:hypothetical protein